MDNANISMIIIELGKNAMNEWLNGNPSPYIELYSNDFTYFDPSLDIRLDGHEKIEELYENMRGKVLVDRFEMINPKVQYTDDMAVLTYNLHMHSGDMIWKENCTEVYHKKIDNEWEIIHSHFSPTKPSLK